MQSFSPYIQSGVIEPLDAFDLFQKNPDTVKFVDCTFSLDDSKKIRESFAQQRLGNAVFFDIEEIADPDSPYPHMLPDEKHFTETVRRLGIGNDDFLICYGQESMTMGPARVWWTFKTFGHDRICVLNGNFSTWQAEGLPVSTDPFLPPAFSQFQAGAQPDKVVSFEAMQTLLNDSSFLVLDARPGGRFNGTEPEPRPDIASGHMKGACNLPAGMLTNPRNGKLYDKEALKNIFAELHLDEADHYVATCGSGVTACMILLALYHMGYYDLKLYDGSWTEWALRKNINSSKKDPANRANT